MRVLVNTKKLSEVFGAATALSGAWGAVEELVRQRPEIEWVVALDEGQPAALDALRAACDGWLNLPKIQVWGTGLAPHPDATYSKWAADVQSIVWGAVVNRTAPDTVLDLDAESDLLKLVAALDSQQSMLTARERNFNRTPGAKPLLALVSPLPAVRSGVADYVQDLVSGLSAWYDIELVVEQDAPVHEALREKFVIRSPQDLLRNPERYARVVYQIGNSQFHKHMFSLLEQVPGMVVMHDIYLGETLNVMEHMSNPPFALTRAAYHAHGYGALLAMRESRYNSQGLIDWPSNLAVLESAIGILVHSEHAKSLVQKWCGAEAASRTEVVPMPRREPAETSRQKARARLGITADTFLVCSMGMMGPTKCNVQLVQAWIASALKDNAQCQLVFVGQADPNLYGRSVQDLTDETKILSKVQITGWCDAQTYSDYLAAADIAVQLRSQSRGETSAAALDCLNYGVPVIANAHGALSELPKNALKLLPENFSKEDLVAALQDLYLSHSTRVEMGKNGRLAVEQSHRPKTCAGAYFMAIEAAYARTETGLSGVIRSIGDLKAFEPDANVLLHIAESIGQTFAKIPAQRQLLVDVSAICRHDLRTGIQRVVRAIVWELIQNPPPGFRVEPVYLSDIGQLWHYRYARRWTSQALELNGDWQVDEVLVPNQGDVLFVADLTSGLAIEARQAGVYTSLRRKGVSLNFCVYDLLPISMPRYFPVEAGNFADWLGTVVQVADRAICISGAVAQDLRDWVAERRPQRLRPLKIDHFHLGADIDNSVPTRGVSAKVRSALDALRGHTSFLMVGTVEPRKGHSQTFAAFEALWRSGYGLHLVIVGKQGWDGQVTGGRKVSKMIEKWRAHPELGNRFHWLPSVTDEELSAIYQASNCLIAASEGEGFGLPLIEAAQNGIPIIARDIPVFREVAGTAAWFFSGLDPADITRAVENWLQLYSRREEPSPAGMRWLTWQQSVAMLLSKLDLGRNKVPNENL